MKNLFSLICMTVIMAIASFTVMAQNLEDVIYLKNGSVIRGIIVEQVPNETLKIQTRDGNLLVYNIADVQKMTKEYPANTKYHGYSSNRNVNSFKTVDFNKPKGYFGLVELGLAPGLLGNEPFRVGATIINGYRVVPQFAIGAGVGLQGYCGFGEMTIPLFLHLRSDFLNRKTSPFIAFNFGYNLSVLGGYYGGLIMEPSVGASFNVGDKYRMTAGLGVSFDQVHFYNRYFGYYSGLDLLLNIKVGFSF